MFDPIELGKRVASRVCTGEKRLYYRFRGGKFYGGIATADTVGCNLRCAFCWSWKASHGIPEGSKLYAPEEVARRLISIARSRGYEMARVTGGEPTLCFKHLVEVIKGVEREGLLFVLETNGILIGYDKRLAEELASHELFVRVSIKGPTAETFSKLTGAKPEVFELQLKALENLVEAGLRPPRVRAAIVVGYGSKEEYAELLRRLAAIHPALADVEFEVLVMYPSVRRRLEKLGLLPEIYYSP